MPNSGGSSVSWKNWAERCRRKTRRRNRQPWQITACWWRRITYRHSTVCRTRASRTASRHWSVATWHHAAVALHCSSWIGLVCMCFLPDRLTTLQKMWAILMNPGQEYQAVSLCRRHLYLDMSTVLMNCCSFISVDTMHLSGTSTIDSVIGRICCKHSHMPHIITMKSQTVIKGTFCITFYFLFLYCDWVLIICLVTQLVGWQERHPACKSHISYSQRLSFGRPGHPAYPGVISRK